MKIPSFNEADVTVPICMALLIFIMAVFNKTSFYLLYRPQNPKYTPQPPF